jgi:hypothetical protein
MVLFSTIGCIEEQGPEPVAELSTAEILQQMKTDYRAESDALAFHLRLNNGNFQDQSLVRGYLASQFGEGSSAISSFERTLATNNGAAMRTETEENSLTQDAQNQIQNYINAADGYDEPSDYVAYLEGEFNSYLSSDLENPTNLGVTLWLVLQAEAVDFIDDNFDLLISSNSNARVDGWLGDWWEENKKCIAAVVGGAIGGGIAGCGLGIGGVAAFASITGATGVGVPLAITAVVGSCVTVGAIGAIGGALVGYSTC